MHQHSQFSTDYRPWSFSGRPRVGRGLECLVHARLRGFLVCVSFFFLFGRCAPLWLWTLHAGCLSPHVPMLGQDGWACGYWPWCQGLALSVARPKHAEYCYEKIIWDTVWGYLWDRGMSLVSSGSKMRGATCKKWDHRGDQSQRITSRTRWVVGHLGGVHRDMRWPDEVTGFYTCRRSRQQATTDPYQRKAMR